MRTLYRSPADIQRGANNLLHSQSLCSNRSADNIDNCVYRPHFVKVDIFNRSIVDLSLSRSQSLEDRNSRRLRALADRSPVNDRPNFFQSPRVRMLMWVWPTRRFSFVLRMLMMLMLMLMVDVGMLMFMGVFRLSPSKLLPRQILLPIHPDVDLGSRNPAPHDPRNLELSFESERGDRLFQDARRNSGIHERAQKHVATHSGKTFKVGNPHSKNVVGR